MFLKIKILNSPEKPCRFAFTNLHASKLKPYIFVETKTCFYANRNSQRTTTLKPRGYAARKCGHPRKNERRSGG